MQAMRWLAVGLLVCIPVLGGGGLLGLTALDWSKDGRYVLYVDEGDVWVGLAPEGRDARRVTTAAATDWARFSPEGGFIYATFTEAGYVVWRSTLEGEKTLLFGQDELNRQPHLSAPIDHIARPAISPDGTHVAFVGHAGGQCDLYLWNLETTTLRQLTRTPGPVDTPDFSPDGASVAFVGLWQIGPTLSWDLYVLELDGDRIELLTQDPFFDWCPRFSPDGEWIAFESNLRGPSDIHVMRRDGRDRTAFTFDEWRNAFPCWNPNGDEIGYGSLRARGWLILASKTS